MYAEYTGIEGVEGIRWIAYTCRPGGLFGSNYSKASVEIIKEL
jgi:hypothetical protein